MIGPTPTKELTAYFDNSTQVNANTPPALLLHSSPDKSVPVENSIAYYNALQKAEISAALHIYNDGNHGFGMKSITSGAAYSKWKDDLLQWLVSMKLISAK